MVIEWLKFKVPSEFRENFIQKDEQIWTKKLAKYPGFLGKEVWINPQVADEVIIVIHWNTRENWQSVPPKILVEIEKQFSQEMGPNNYKMIEIGEYQVRKFPQVPH